MPYFAQDFRRHLSSERVLELQDSASVVMGLRADNTVGYRNGAWDRFATDNGAPELAQWNGRSILEVFHPKVRGFYANLFERVRATGEPADHRYQCSSPELYREFVMRVLPLGDGCLLVIHHLLVDKAHHWEAHEPQGGCKAAAVVGESLVGNSLPDKVVGPDPRYKGPGGFVTQCCHCRRVRRERDHQTWDWVPAYMKAMDCVSYGLCYQCVRHHYPELSVTRPERAD